MADSSPADPYFPGLQRPRRVMLSGRLIISWHCLLAPFFLGGIAACDDRLAAAEDNAIVLDANPTDSPPSDARRDLRDPCDTPEICNNLDDDCDGVVDGDAAASSCPVERGVGACVEGSCAIGECAIGYADCNGEVDDGCETSLSSPSDCGGCGLPCDASDLSAECIGLECIIGECGESRADCDGDSRNGCETLLSTSPFSCGACGVRCSSGEICMNGSCATRRPTIEVAVSWPTGMMCYVDQSESLWCWGSTDGGVPAITPLRIADVDGLDSLRVRSLPAAVCGLVSSEVVCWLGDSILNGATSVKAFDLHFTYVCAPVCRARERACFVTTNGQAECPTEGLTSEFDDGIDVVLAADAVCVLREGGNVSCFSFTGTQQWVDVPVPDVVEVAAAGSYLLARRSDGSAVEVDLHDLHGEFPSLGRQREQVPGLVSASLPSVTRLGSFCAIELGNVLCWGANGAGQLGTGGLQESAAPLPISIHPRLDGAAVDVSCSNDRCCASYDTGEVFCWGGGYSSVRVLGDGRSVESPVPTPVHCAGGADLVSAEAHEGEVCDRVNADCDGEVDETCFTCVRDTNAACSLPDPGPACTSGFRCFFEPDSIPSECRPHAGDREVCGDGMDNDCNDLVDDGC